MLNSSGEVYVTGINKFGELGQELTTKKTSEFEKIVSLEKIARIDANDSSNIALNIDGNIYTWGQNIYGELGIGNKISTYVPTQIPDIANIVDVSGGKCHSIIQDREGNIYTCGTNTFGNLGNGTLDESLQFTKVPDFGGIMEISAGNYYSAIAKVDGTVWGFGDYNQGDENFESQTNSAVPIQIGAENFKIEPKKKIMYVNETEDLLSELEIKEFNLFYTRNKNVEDYSWESSNEASVEVNSGKLKAKAVGNANITATDNITGTKKTIERIVVEEEKDRIEKITINEKKADIVKECEYKIIIEEKDKNGILTIKSRYSTDKISLDGTNWTENNILTENLDIKQKEFDMPFFIKTQNGTIIEYTLKIYVKSHNSELEFIKVNDASTIKKEDGTYYIHLDALGEEVSIHAKAIDENASVRIESASYEIRETTRQKMIDAKETICYIYIKAEDDTVIKYTLIISGLPDDATLMKVTVNGENAKYIEGKNKYEIRLNADKYNVEAFATDSLAKVKINEEAEEVGTKATIINKSGNVTKVQITVTAQNGMDKGEYILEITEKSNDTEISYVIVNGENAIKEEDGNFVAYIKEAENSAEINIGARDKYAVVSLEGITQGKNTIIDTKTITDKETTFEIQVVAEDGTTKTRTLTIKKQSANTNIDKITVATTKNITNEETGDIEAKRDEEEAVLKEDGKYYAKIARENKAEVKVELNDKNASVKIKNSEFNLGTITKEVETNAEKTEVMITVKAEDGTIKDYILVLEKKSNDTEIKEISSIDIQKRVDNTIYVDEALNEIDLKIITRSELANIKLTSEANYEIQTITRNIKLSGSDIVKDDDGAILVNVDVQAEDGTTKTHTIRIIREGNSNILSVKVNTEEVPNIEDKYTKEVKTDTAEVEITAENPKAKVEIIKVTEGEGTVAEKVLGTATGVLTLNLAVAEGGTEYRIRITSESAVVSKDYTLNLTRPTSVNAKIKGKIITENIEGKHKSQINVYKDGESTVYETKQTNEDGTFEITIGETGKYRLEVIKQGYLKYTVTDIIIEEGQEIIIQAYNLIGGDVLKTEEINIDDLVLLNDAYGEECQEENSVNVKFDLNEDKKIDTADRDILKKNYGKKAESKIMK